MHEPQRMDDGPAPSNSEESLQAAGKDEGPEVNAGENSAVCVYSVITPSRSDLSSDTVSGPASNLDLATALLMASAGLQLFSLAVDGVALRHVPHLTGVEHGLQATVGTQLRDSLAADGLSLLGSIVVVASDCIVSG